MAEREGRRELTFSLPVPSCLCHSEFGGGWSGSVSNTNLNARNLTRSLRLVLPGLLNANGCARNAGK